MKKLLVLAAAALLLGSTFGARAESVSASDSRIVFVGRTLVQDGTVSYDWAGVYARIRYTGPYIALRMGDSKKNFYNVWVDAPMSEAPTSVVSVQGPDTLLVICDGKRSSKSLKAEHTLIIQKRTEGEQGIACFKGVEVAGELLQAEPVKDRVIEFVGDSFTCGYGSENSVATDPFKPETENCNRTYAALSSRYFDADWYLVAHSGMGIARNYNSKFPEYHMSEEYMRTFDTVAKEDWQGNGIHPDLTVVYLGTNDFSVNMQPSRASFTKGYIKLLKEIKAAHGQDHPILCMAAKKDLELHSYVQEAIASSGLSGVYFLGQWPSVHGEGEDFGASYHPSWKGHRKLASVVIPHISTIMGWSMKDDLK